MPIGLSPLASRFINRIEPTRQSPVFGVVMHTTGSGVVVQAAKTHADVLDYTVKIYANRDNFCGHYVIGWDGAVVQIVDENQRAQHVGYSNGDHQAMLDGTWAEKVAPKTAELWKARWAGHSGPAYLFPGTSPNSVYVGCEMIPLTDASQPTPMADSLTFTKEQHLSAARLISDIAMRWNLPINEVLSPQKGRLLGHEDLQPLERSDAGGGWDPGALRDVPRFDYAFVRSFIANLRANV